MRIANVCTAGSAVERARIVPTLLLCAVSGCASAPFRADPVYFPPPPATPHAVHLKAFNSLSELVPPRTSWVEVLRGASVSPFVGTPAGLAYAGDELYVCDPTAGLVHRWNLATGEAARFGAADDLQLSTPVAVAVDASGLVYVADTGRGEVVVFDRDGTARQEIKPADREAYRPVALVVHGSQLYVADLASHQIDVVSIGDGQPASVIGAGDDDSLYYPVGLAIGEDGGVLVSEMINARVRLFDARHRPAGIVGQPGDRYGDLGKPKALAVGPDGTVFVADAEFARVHLFDRQGRLLMLLGDDGTGPGSTPMPVGLAIATAVPPRLASAVPPGFQTHYFLFVANTVGPKRVSLYAIGVGGNRQIDR